MLEARQVTPINVDETAFKAAPLRLRPMITTAATIFAGLIPIMDGMGTDPEIMQRHCRANGGRHGTSRPAFKCDRSAAQQKVEDYPAPDSGFTANATR
jgi:hypothetical protein